MSRNQLIAGLTIVAALFLGSGLAMAAHSDDLGCGNCHVAHKAVVADGSTYGVPLWSPAYSTTAALPTFTVYTSAAFDLLSTGITQPDGPSKLCLGCHDGAYTGVTAAHTIGDGKAMTLTESHPISFVYNTALSTSTKLKVPGELWDPSTKLSGLTPTGTIVTDMLDKNSKVQCTSCHDVHTTGKGVYQLRVDYTDGKTLCQKCHNK